MADDPAEPASADRTAARLLDRAALRDLVERYAAGVDRHEGNAVAALFALDGELHVFGDPTATEPTGIRRGRGEIATAIDSLSRYRATAHLIGSHRVAVAGDGATGETRCAGHHVTADPAGDRDRVLFIRYVDTFERIEGEWYFRRREVRVEFVEERPLVIA